MNQKVLVVLCILFAFLLGGAVMWSYQHRNTSDLSVLNDRALEQMFNDRFFERSRSPFEEMERIQREMHDLLGDRSDLPGFDTWFDRHYGEFPINRITSREDSDHIYYVLDIEDQDFTNLEVNTEDGYVTIRAELKRKEGNNLSSFSLNQRFPVPSNVDPDSVKVLHEGDEVLIRFNKRYH